MARGEIGKRFFVHFREHFCGLPLTGIRTAGQQKLERPRRTRPPLHRYRVRYRCHSVSILSRTAKFSDGELGSSPKEAKKSNLQCHCCTRRKDVACCVSAAP